MKSVSIEFMLEPSEKLVIQQAAHVRSKTVSNMIREILLPAVHSIVTEAPKENQ